MTNIEFNNKYKYLLESYENNGEVMFHDGLCFNNPEVVEFLDEIFGNVCSKMDGFKYSQIKVKFGKCRFYSNVQGFEFSMMIEQKINELLNKKWAE